MELVASILAADVESLARLARSQAPFADVLELRLDRCADAGREALARLFASVGRPVLAAVNGPEAFGTFAGSDEQRLRALADADAAGAAWIDVPWNLADRLGPTRARRVVSRHVLDGTPADLEAELAQLEQAARPSDRLKLVTHARCAEDALRVLLLCRRRADAGRPIVAFASGAAGSFSRLLAPIAGSLATYASPARGSGSATAPGQIPADELRAAWPARGPGRSTRVLGVVGRPVGHSLSPLLHGAGLRALGLDAVYAAFEPADFAAFLALAQELGLHGLSVTMPFKAEAAQLAAERDAAVEACGAANTLVWNGAGWSATNTDAGAVRVCVGRALGTQHRKLSGSTAIVVGTGGAARAALHGLRGADLVVAGRDRQKREALARAFGARACDPAQIATIAHDVLVHTTPLGSRQHPEACPVPPDAVRAGSIVLDAVYRPSDTPLLRAARAAGALAISGSEWFLEQGLAQFRAFTDADPPETTMRAALASALAAEEGAGTLLLAAGEPTGTVRPIALVGLRASGKSTVGRVLAARLGRAFVDLDHETALEDAALRGVPELRPIGQVLEQLGLERFRDLESRALERVLARTQPLVIATGGGVVERAQNRLLLRTRADCVWLRVPVGELQRRLRADPTPRPTLTGTDPVAEVPAIAARREAWFRELSPRIVDGAGPSPEAVAEDILRRLAGAGGGI